jgi:hypothetical protein
MSDRGRYDSAMFWLAFGTAAAVIGLALMTIGVTRLTPGASLLSTPWFDAGLAILALGGLLLIWALLLFLTRRRESAAAPTQPADPKQTRDVEAIRGYFKDRERLFKLWEKDSKNRR